MQSNFFNKIDFGMPGMGEMPGTGSMGMPGMGGMGEDEDGEGIEDLDK